MITREVMGILLICLIFSTIVVAIAAMVRKRQGLVLVRNEYPRTLSKQGESHGFHFELLADKAYDEVELRFAYLLKESPTLLDDWDPDSPEKNTLSMSILSDLPVRAGMDTQLAMEPFSVDGEDAIILLYDYSDVAPFIPEYSSMPTVYGLVVNHGGDLVAYYEGSPGFFPAADRTLDRLLVEMGPRSILYSKDALEEDSALPLDEAPAGNITLREIQSGDRIRVSFLVDPAMWPSRKDMIQLIQVVEERPWLVMNRIP